MNFSFINSRFFLISILIKLSLINGNVHAHGINRHIGTYTDNIDNTDIKSLRGHGSEVGRQGASKEVQDVGDELIHMRLLESNIEKDLANILESVTGNRFLSHYNVPFFYFYIPSLI